MSEYTVYLNPESHKQIKSLPGNVKQRLKKIIGNLADNPRPSFGKKLNLPEFEQELWRLRLDKWRIIYGITEKEKIVDVVGIRKRPPYDYGDLQELLAQL